MRYFSHQKSSQWVIAVRYQPPNYPLSGHTGNELTGKPGRKFHPDTGKFPWKSRQTPMITGGSNQTKKNM
jgi:hypothetical protein